MKKKVFFFIQAFFFFLSICHYLSTCKFSTHLKYQKCKMWYTFNFLVIIASHTLKVFRVFLQLYIRFNSYFNAACKTRTSRRGKHFNFNKTNDSCNKIFWIKTKYSIKTLYFRKLVQFALGMTKPWCNLTCLSLDGQPNIPGVWKVYKIYKLTKEEWNLGPYFAMRSYPD